MLDNLDNATIGSVEITENSNEKIVVKCKTNNTPKINKDTMTFERDLLDFLSRKDALIENKTASFDLIFDIKDDRLIVTMNKVNYQVYNQRGTPMAGPPKNIQSEDKRNLNNRTPLLRDSVFNTIKKELTL